MARRGGGFRIAAALALAAVLVTATPLAAAGLDGLGRVAPSWTVLQTLWTWTRAWLDLFLGEAAPARAPAAPKAACDGGSMVDPNGCPAHGPTAGTTSDAGASIDPDG
jgi:hypothetical protein